MRFGSVCSGIEAASVAWHPLGWEAAFVADIDPFACFALHHHYSSGRPRFMPAGMASAAKSVAALPALANGPPNLGDMTRYREWPDAALDVLVGGTPCQAFSVAGLRKGLDDPRGNLTLTYLGLVERYKPRWIIWENVPGVLSVDGGRTFGAFLGGLGLLGYGWAYRVLDAQYVRVDGYPSAVPQRRQRVFVVGHLGDRRRAAAVLFEPEGLRGDPAPRRQAGQRVAATLGASLRGGGGVDSDFGRGLIAGTLNANGKAAGSATQQDAENGLLVAFGGNDTRGPIEVSTALNAHGGPSGRMDFDSETFVAHALRAEGFDAGEDGPGRGTPLVPIAFDARQSDVCVYGDRTGPLDTDGHTQAIAFSIRGRDGGSVPEAEPTRIAPAMRVSQSGSSHTFLAFAENSRHELRLEGGDGEIVAALKTGGSKPGQSFPAITNGWAVRRLTPRECERLQGFPDGYTLVPYRGKPAADGPRYRALGNSMAVNVMRWIGARIALLEKVLPA